MELPLLDRHQTDAAEQAARRSSRKMTVACSMASFGCCVQLRHGAACRRSTVPAPLVTIASFGGGGLGVWDRIMDAQAVGHNAAVRMIDTSVVRVHQHGACIADNNHQEMGRSRGA
jgi:hypothetical protein